MARRRRAATIRKKYDLRFEPLGCVDGHYPHRVRASLHVALDRVFEPRKTVEECGERARFRVFIGDCEAQKLVDRIASLGSQPGFDVAPPALSSEKGRIESKRTAPSTRAPPAEFCGRGGLTARARSV